MTEMQWRRIFAFRVRRYLYKYNMTQSQLADAIYVQRSTVSNYLSGKITPNITTLVNMAYVFDCYVTDLISVGENIW